jgi:hypothetical protein
MGKNYVNMRVITGRNVNLKLIRSDTIHNIAE